LIDRSRDLHRRLGLVLPGARFAQAHFEIAHAGEVLVQALLVTGAHTLLEPAHLIRHRVHDALPELEPALLLAHLVGGAAHEQLLEHRRGLVLAGDQRAGIGPRQAALATSDIDPQGQGGEAGEVADVLRGILVERDGVAEAAIAGVRGGGEEAVVGRMPAIHERMGDAAEDGEVIAVLLDRLEVG